MLIQYNTTYALLNYIVLITEMLNAQYFQGWIQRKGILQEVFLLIEHKKKIYTYIIPFIIIPSIYNQWLYSL